MLTVKDWMELVEYRITEGDSYGWRCFGSDAFSLSAWNGDHNGWSMNMVFDTGTQTVYTVEVCDYARDRAYRVINPDFKQAHDDEARTRGINAKEAWDDVDYIDLDEDHDFTEKGRAIRDGEDYDLRVSVPLNVPDDVLFELMKKAHEQDVTLNKMIEDVLLAAIHAEESRQKDDDDDGWDEICEDHLDDDGDEMASDMFELAPQAKMKSAKKKHKKKA